MKKIIIWDQLTPEVRNVITGVLNGMEINPASVFDSDAGKPHQEDEQKSSWMTRKEAAAYAKCSVDTIDGLLAKGVVICAKFSDKRPGRVLIDSDSLEKFIRSKVSNPAKRNRNQAPSVKGGYRVQSSNS